MTITEFVKTFAEKKIVNTKINEHAVSDYLKKELEIRTYIPFKKKREIAEMVVAQNIKEVDGVKKYDSIGGYVSLIVASIMTHTNLQFGQDPVADYDLLAESGLLTEILSEFEGSHTEIDMLLHMVLDMEMEDNEINAVVGRFLNKVSGMLDGIAEVAKDKIENLDLKDTFGADIKPEDLAKLSSFLDKLK